MVRSEESGKANVNGESTKDNISGICLGHQKFLENFSCRRTLRMNYMDIEHGHNIKIMVDILCKESPTCNNNFRLI